MSCYYIYRKVVHDSASDRNVTKSWYQFGEIERSLDNHRELIVNIAKNGNLLGFPNSEKPEVTAPYAVFWRAWTAKKIEIFWKWEPRGVPNHPPKVEKRFPFSGKLAIQRIWEPFRNPPTGITSSVRIVKFYPHYQHYLWEFVTF